MRGNTSTGPGGGSKSSTSTVRAWTNCCCSAFPAATTMNADQRGEDRTEDHHAGGKPPRKRRTREAGTRALLDSFAVGDPDDLLPLRDLLAGLGRRAFGMLLFIASLPAFIPIPIGGAIA